ncbi:adenylate kinase 9-like [Megalopta genalis]|uniref:adenylate kinase 9-like n=1 Tax=Megalopta genalis TaxID=115081 RepID=UPI003FCFB3FE
MCDKVTRQERKPREKCKFRADASFIVKKSFLPYIKGRPRDDYEHPWPEPHRCVYPKAVSYYAFHEDANPLTRFKGKRESRRYGNVEPHFEPPAHPYASRDPYRETDARTKYLRTGPTCFVIFGKPDLNTARLAAMLADSWKCVLISPVQLVEREIELASEKGKLISEILKAGECLGSDIIGNLVESAINERATFHRGYVVEGLPLISNKVLPYPRTYPPENERKLGEKFLQRYGPAFGGTCDTSNEKRDESTSCVRDPPETEGCATRPGYERFIPNQIDDMFASWRLKPTVIIYAVCPDEDFVRKRGHFRMDAATGRTVDASVSMIEKDAEASLADANVSLELYRGLVDKERVSDAKRKKYLLKRISDRRSNVEAQRETYKRFAMPAIDKWVLLHKPENVIRLDGRGSVSQMFRTVMSRLRTLPVPRVILAKRFLDLAAMRFGGESPVPVDEFEDRPNEEAFPYLANRDTVSPLYPWLLSTWNFLCPVELARGRTTEGSPKFAVRFMNKIFFLSSDEAAGLFLENPRTFVCPFAPQPTCKIAVFGPRLSGRSSLCKVLAETFGGVVVNPGKSDSDSDVFFDSDFELDRPNSLADRILSIPQKEIDVGVWRDGGYVVDGMYPDVDTWKTTTEGSNVAFEDAVLLYDEDPYEYLLSKWKNIREKEYEEERASYDDDDEEEETDGLAEYLKHVRQFELDWEEIRETIAGSCRNLITCNLGEIKNVSAFVIDAIRDRYKDKARVMSEDERERERDLAEYVAMSDDTENVGEEEELGEEERGTTLESNPRLGDTDQYCPVALVKHNVFWKGKDDYSAVFANKIYRLSSGSALEEFIKDPEALSLPFERPLLAIPPLRISVIGPLGSGKTNLAKAIAREYGLAYVDQFDSFNRYMIESGIPPLQHRSITVSIRDRLEEEVELPEELDDARYVTDRATLHTFVRRYSRSGSALPKFMLRECLLKYFKGLYGAEGVVMEQFPSCPQDVETAFEHYAVPDVIIELECGKATARHRTMMEMAKLWMTTQDKEKHLEQQRYMDEVDRYEKEKDAWTKKRLSRAIMLLRGGEEAASWHSLGLSDSDSDAESRSKQTRRLDEDDDDDDDDDDDITDIDSETIRNKRQELLEIWKEDNPEPVLFADWEDYVAARLRMEQDFEEAYANDTRLLQATREALRDESIPYMKLNSEGSFDTVLLRAMIALKPYTTRDLTALKRPYAIDLETAEMLLECGYFFLSSFGRWCPVQLYLKKTPLQMFLPSEARQEVFPVIHRQFVYFLVGEDARSAFLKNPCKYIEQDSCAPVIPFRLAIIGPPKCGKTSLARRFAEKYGVKVVTRGAALRHLPNHLPWTESAQIAESHLREGRRVPMESVVRAVEICSIDPLTAAQGLVFDGFPSSRDEFEKLALLGIQPLLTLDLVANLEFCLQCLASRVQEPPQKFPNFSGEFLKHRYANWDIDRAGFREWLKRYTQNVVELDATRSTWHVWTRADEETCLRYARIRSYFRESDYDKCHSLEFMSVSPYEFKARQSEFEAYCPGCLLRDGATKSSGLVPDRRGMVQLRGRFYWVCGEHLADFAANPLKYLPPASTASLPKDRARILTETVDVEHFCWTRRLRVDGYCLVSYADNLPARKLVPGKPTIAALYKDQLYLFCAEECRDKFLTYSARYASVDIKFRRTLPAINVKDLPVLGFLEQTVARKIVQVVNQITVIRPKLPGLSAAATAAVFIGIDLKTRNPSSNDVKLYQEADDRLRILYKAIKAATRNMKRKLNPFVTVPVYSDMVSADDDITRAGFRMSKQVSILSHFHPRSSYTITFRRTSPTQHMPLDDDDDA